MSSAAASRPSGAPTDREPDRRRIHRLIDRFARSETSRRGGRTTAPYAGPSNRRAALLAAAGPVLSAYGAYLSSRRDLLDAAACRDLALLRRHAVPTPTADLVSLVEPRLAALGMPRLELFERQPEAVGRYAQRHTARRLDGTVVDVEITHPRWWPGTDRPSRRGRGDSELAMLPLLRRVLAPDLVGPPARAEAALALAEADFVSFLRVASDRRHDAGELAADRRVGTVPPHGGESFIRVRRPASGRPLATFLSTSRARGFEREPWRPAGADGLDATHVVRLVVRRFWDILALEGCLWTSICHQRTQVDAATGLIVAHGVIEHPTATELRHLLAYVQAASRRDPDLATDALRALTRAGKHDDVDTWRMQMRAATPMKDRGAESWRGHLSEELLLHWSLLGEHGRRAGPALQALYRAIVELADLVDGLALPNDLLDEEWTASRFAGELDRWWSIASLGIPFLLGQPLRGSTATHEIAQAARQLSQLPEQLATTCDTLRRDGIRIEIAEPPRRAARPRGVSGIALAILLPVTVTTVVQSAGDAVIHPIAAAGLFVLYILGLTVGRFS